jgi:hypothetical protein
MLINAREAIKKNDLNKWTSSQLKDIESVLLEKQNLQREPEEGVRMN